jgi:magnesium chelatase family protein
LAHFRLKDSTGMLFKARSAAVYGIDAHIIDVEVDFSGIKTQEETSATQ